MSPRYGRFKKEHIACMMIILSLWLLVSTFVAIPLLILHERYAMETAVRRELSANGGAAGGSVLGFYPMANGDSVVQQGLLHPADAVEADDVMVVDTATDEATVSNQEAPVLQEDIVTDVPFSGFCEGWPVVVAASTFFLVGIGLGRRALQLWRAWELHRQEDGLLYDLAYTTTVKEIGYGTYCQPMGGLRRYYDV